MTSPDVALLELLGFSIVAAAVIERLLRPLKVPSIVAYVAAGLVLGPVAGQLAPEAIEAEVVKVMGEVGIVLLLFLVGLELSLDRIKQVGKVAVVAGLGQVIFTAAGGLVLCRLLDFEWMAAVFVSTALTFSSTVVVVKLLDQKGELHSLYGRIAVGIFLVQDLVVIIALTLLAGLGSGETGAEELAFSLGKAFLGMGALLFICLLAARYLLPRPLAWLARDRRLLLVGALAWCLAVVVLAETLGLSPEIGAFLAGISLAQLEEAHPLERRVHPLMSFFIIIFFVMLGAQMRFDAAEQYAFEAVVLSLFVLIGNPFIFLFIIARSGYSRRTAFMTSVTVAQISELSFVFATLGSDAGLIDTSILSLIGMIGIVTIAVSAYLILYNRQLYERFERWGLLRIFGGANGAEDPPPEPRPEEHVVVFGMNDLGRRIVRGLCEAGHQVIAVDTDPGKLEGLGCDHAVGDADDPSFLEQLNLGAAKLAVSALRIESVNRLLAYRCKALGVPLAVHAFDRQTSDALVAFEPAMLLEPKREAALKIRARLDALEATE